MSGLENNPGLTNGKRGARPDVCTIQVKEPRASDGQKEYYGECVKAKTHFMNRDFTAPDGSKAKLGHWGCMEVLRLAAKVDASGDVVELLKKHLPKPKTEAGAKPKAEKKTKPRPKPKAKKK